MARASGSKRAARFGPDAFFICLSNTTGQQFSSQRLTARVDCRSPGGVAWIAGNDAGGAGAPIIRLDCAHLLLPKSTDRLTFDQSQIEQKRSRPWIFLTMRNRDLIAFLKPILNQFSGNDSVEFIDVTGQVTDIRAKPHRLAVRVNVPAGLYSGRFETTPNAFDMSTAMIKMVRVPDGKRVPVGPWDLDHIRNVMAVPMVRTYVNGKLKGGLWFDLPGPEQIAEGRLAAEFGFEAQEGENELILELIERDRERMNWGKLAYLELRKDDRGFNPAPTYFSLLR
jgi:hypothetical protein